MGVPSRDDQGESECQVVRGVSNVTAATLDVPLAQPGTAPPFEEVSHSVLEREIDN